MIAIYLDKSYSRLIMHAVMGDLGLYTNKAVNLVLPAGFYTKEILLSKAPWLDSSLLPSFYPTPQSKTYRSTKRKLKSSHTSVLYSPCRPCVAFVSISMLYHQPASQPNLSHLDNIPERQFKISCTEPINERAYYKPQRPIAPSRNNSM
jgi:hypothetical protein